MSESSFEWFKSLFDLSDETKTISWVLPFSFILMGSLYLTVIISVASLKTKHPSLIKTIILVFKIINFVLMGIIILFFIFGTVNWISLGLITTIIVFQTGSLFVKKKGIDLIIDIINFVLSIISTIYTYSRKQNIPHINLSDANADPRRIRRTGRSRKKTQKSSTKKSLYTDREPRIRAYDWNPKTRPIAIKTQRKVIPPAPTRPLPSLNTGISETVETEIAAPADEDILQDVDYGALPNVSSMQIPIMKEHKKHKGFSEAGRKCTFCDGQYDNTPILYCTNPTCPSILPSNEENISKFFKQSCGRPNTFCKGTMRKSSGLSCNKCTSVKLRKDINNL